MVNNSYIYEVKFYLSIMIYEKFLKNSWVLMDEYEKVIRYIYNDYVQYDNNKKSLLDSVNDYIELRKDFILELLKSCIEK